MMRLFFLFYGLFASLTFFAQTEKGAAPLPSSFSHPKSTGKTRAVVVGISDYADDRIPDLRFADRDADAFANYLQAPAGGALPNDQLALLTNAQATAGKIIAALEWLIAESRAGDRAIIYFSGHGDVERVTKFQRGYLLAHDSPGTTYMAGGSLPVGFLSDVITTLSETGVQVVMVSDACRSGKLAGSANGGTQATSAALAQQFSNEIKILSCQPEEFSLEGEQWGGGRGCFSFHLVDALTGMADANADGTVNLLEAGRYLEDKVPSETAPHSQIPMTMGSKGTALAVVEQGALADLRKRKQAPTLSTIDAKGFEDMVLAKADTSVQRLYAAFTAALERGDLMAPSDASANDFYEQLLPKPGIEKLKGLMTRNLAAALQDEAQVVINQLLRTDPQIVDDAFSPVSKYDHLPGYLHRAGELLGEGHYMYRFIKAREYYFKAKGCRKENYPDLASDSLMNLALARLDTSLMFDSAATYTYMEKGSIYYWKKHNYEEALSACKMALAFSPAWVLPNYLAGRIISNVFDDDAGLAFIEKAISLDSNFLPSYLVFGWRYGNYLGQGDKWFNTYIFKMNEFIRTHPGKVPALYYNYLGNALLWLNRYMEAEASLLKAGELSDFQLFPVFRNLGVLYMNLGRYAEAESYIQRLIMQNKNPPEALNQLGVLNYFYQNMPAPHSITLFRRASETLSYYPYAAFNLNAIYIRENQLDSARQVVNKWLEIAPEDLQGWLRSGQLYRLQSNPAEAWGCFQKLYELSSRKKDDLNAPVFYYQTVARLHLGKIDAIGEFLEMERKKLNDHPGYYYYVACAYALFGDAGTALKWLENAFQKGWKPQSAEDIYDTLHYPDLDSIRHTKQFKKLVKKYLPEQALIMNIK